MFDVTHVKHKELIFLRKMLLKLHFEVLYRRILFVMSIVYYFGDPNHGIPRATASIIQNNDASYMIIYIIGLWLMTYGNIPNYSTGKLYAATIIGMRSRTTTCIMLMHELRLSI